MQKLGQNCNRLFNNASSKDASLKEEISVFNVKKIFYFYFFGDKDVINNNSDDIEQLVFSNVYVVVEFT